MTYEYMCAACHHEWEAEQSITAAPLTTCPHCQQASAKRQVSGGAGFILKGGGWYADGYGTPTKKKDGATETKTADNPKSSNADAKPSDNKSDSKTSDTKASDTKPTGNTATTA